MKRVDSNAVVHFASDPFTTLCGKRAGKDLWGKPQRLNETTAPVNCPDCARLYCEIKNAPWNEVDGDALDRGIYAAVGETHETGRTETEGGEA